MGRPKEPVQFDVRELALKLFSYDPETGVLTRIAYQTRAREIVPLPEPKPAGCLKDGYLRVSLFGRSFYVHRLAWLIVHGEWPDVIDHINGDRSDNRIANLRSITDAENHQNIRRPKVNNPHGMLGVNWHAGAGKFMAQISVNNRSKYLGLFDTAEEAQAAYFHAKRELHDLATI